MATRDYRLAELSQEPPRPVYRCSCCVKTRVERTCCRFVVSGATVHGLLLRRLSPWKPR